MDPVADGSVYPAMEGVLQVVRRRLTVQQARGFASVLPTVPGAVFVAGRRVDAQPLPFAKRHPLKQDVRQVRPHHDLTPDKAINAIKARTRTLRDILTRWLLRASLQNFPKGRRDSGISILRSRPGPGKGFSGGA